ncbi:MAG TPA: HDOD domain-containing protein [Gelria sp.]|jgi:putative nucleotidyltransferase with HDIG domain|nr:HDOD domain-containing protein [Gelria sp.]
MNNKNKTRNTILFVDDETYILDSLRRRLRTMNERWQILFADSAKSALELMAQYDVDVVITDLVMPGCNGVELLEKVAHTHPHTVRIILSGNIDRLTALGSTEVAHQFINKPTSAEELRILVERICQLRDLLDNRKYIRLATEIQNLPSLPSTYYELLEEINAPDPSIKRIGSIINKDLGMTAKVLQIINSAFFGLPHRVYSVDQAVALLGLDTLRALVIHVNIFSSFPPGRTVLSSVLSLRDHSLLVGYLAKKILQEEKVQKELAEKAMLVGILHDIGYLLLAHMPDISRQVIQMSREHGYSLAEAEYELTGISHAEIGAYLLGIWGFEEELVEAVAFHHHPSQAPHPGSGMLMAVYIADTLLNWVGETIGGKEKLSLNYLQNQGMALDMDYWINVADDLQKKVGTAHE